MENWQQRGDGMQRVRTHHLGDRKAAAAAVAWVDLSQLSPCTDSVSGGGEPPDYGALAMLFDSGWLTLYSENGDVVHEQRIFRPDVKQAENWRPVCNHRSGMLLLTAPNAIYVIQDQNIANTFERRTSGTSDLSVAACPLPGNFNPPQ